MKMAILDPKTGITIVMSSTKSLVTRYVKVGDIVFGNSDNTYMLKTSLGSCVGLALYDQITGMGGLPTYYSQQRTITIRTNLKYVLESTQQVRSITWSRSLLGVMFQFHAFRLRLPGGIDVSIIRNAKFNICCRKKNFTTTIDCLAAEGIKVVGKDMGKNFGRIRSFISKMV